MGVGRRGVGVVGADRGDVERLVDGRWDRLDLGPELLFDPVQVEPVLVRDLRTSDQLPFQQKEEDEAAHEVDGYPAVTETAGTTDAVQVGLCVLGEVEVDDDVDGLDVDTAGQQICVPDHNLISPSYRLIEV